MAIDNQLLINAIQYANQFFTPDTPDWEAYVKDILSRPVSNQEGIQGGYGANKADVDALTSEQLSAANRERQSQLAYTQTDNRNNNQVVSQADRDNAQAQLKATQDQIAAQNNSQSLPTQTDKGQPFMVPQDWRGIGQSIAGDILRGGAGGAGNAPTNEAFTRSIGALEEQAAREREYESAAAARAAQPEAVRAAMLTEATARGAGEQARAQLGGAAGAGAAALAGAQQAEQARAGFAGQAAQMAQQYKLGEEQKAYERGLTARQTEAGARAEEKERVAAQHDYQQMLKRNREQDELMNKAGQASEKETSDKRAYEQWRVQNIDARGKISFETWRAMTDDQRSRYGANPGTTGQNGDTERKPGDESADAAAKAAAEGTQSEGGTRPDPSQTGTPIDINSQDGSTALTNAQTKWVAGTFDAQRDLARLGFTSEQLSVIQQQAEAVTSQGKIAKQQGKSIKWDYSGRAVDYFKAVKANNVKTLPVEIVDTPSDRRIKTNIIPVLSDFDMKQIQLAQRSMMRRFA